MDSLSSKTAILFSFGNLALDGPALTEPWQAYLRLVGDSKMEVRADTIYAEEQFCLVEFDLDARLKSCRSQYQSR
jgi:hypothetical protein